MKKALLILFAVVTLLIAYDSFYVIEESRRGVLTHFGKVAPPVREPGLHLKFPRPISKVYGVDHRIQVLSGLSQELITEDQKNVFVDGRVVYRVVDPIRFVEAIRTDLSAVERLQDLYFSASGIVISNEARDAFVSLGLDREDLHVAAQDIRNRIRPTALQEYGIDVLEVGIVEYTLPVENRPSVIRRMISERARIAARYRSEGEEQAITIEALALNEHEKIMANAHAEATTILGEAEAEAMTLLAAAYREDPEFYKFVRALDSYDAIIDQNTTLMLPADNELFRYLDSNEIPSP